jgi:hypothetical protein
MDLKDIKHPPEVKAIIAMDMTDAVTKICADGIRAENPKITDKDLLTEIRKRIAERRGE